MSRIKQYDESQNLYKHQLMSNHIRSIHSSMNASRVVDVSNQLSDLIINRPKTRDHLDRSKNLVN